MKQYRFLGLHKESGGSLTCVDVPPEGFFEPDTAKTVYFGGFNNLNGEQLDSGFLYRLVRYVGADLFFDKRHRFLTVVEEEAGGHAEILECVHRFNRAAETTKADRHFVETYLFPRVILDAPLSETEKVERLRCHLSGINFLGYSAGASIIQRIQAQAIAYMCEKGFNPDSIAACNKCLVAHIFGPVSNPVMLSQGFTQLVHTHRNDLVARMMGPLNFQDIPDNGSAVTYHHNAGSLMVCSEWGDLMQRTIQYQPEELISKIAINKKKHGYGHSPPLYLNDAMICPDKQMMVFPSLPGTALCRKFFQQVIEGSIASVQNQRPRACGLIDSFVQDHLGTDDIQKVGRDFEAVIAMFEELTAPDNVLQTMLDFPRHIGSNPEVSPLVPVSSRKCGVPGLRNGN